jgi:hypothetical protein
MFLLLTVGNERYIIGAVSNGKMFNQLDAASNGSLIFLHQQ